MISNQSITSELSPGVDTSLKQICLTKGQEDNTCDIISAIIYNDLQTSSRQNASSIIDLCPVENRTQSIKNSPSHPLVSDRLHSNLTSASSTQNSLNSPSKNDSDAGMHNLTRSNTWKSSFQNFDRMKAGKALAEDAIKVCCENNEYNVLCFCWVF